MILWSKWFIPPKYAPDLPCVWTVPTAPQMQLPVTSPTIVPSEPQLPTSDALAAVAQLFQSPHGQEVSYKTIVGAPAFWNHGIWSKVEVLNESSIFQLQRILQNFQQADKTLSATFANNMATSPHVPLTQLNPYSTLKENKSSLAEVINRLTQCYDISFDNPVNVTFVKNFSLETPWSIWVRWWPRGYNG